MQDLIDLRDESGPPSWSRESHCSAKTDGYVELRRRNLNENAAIAFDVIDRVEDAAREDVETGIERIYEEVDSLLQEGKFGVLDELLRLVDIQRFFVVHMLAFISITSTARERLTSSRTAFIMRVRAHLAKAEPGRVEELLAGIE